MTGFRCSAASVERGDAMAGTASTVRAFLLVECAGPWGVAALRDARLPHDVKTGLRAAAAHGVRALLIRRHGRADTTGAHVFAAFAHPERPWMETAVLDRPADVLGLDLAALGAGRSLGLAPTSEPLFLVCTHGRHDACCAERGRPVAAALADVEPAATWEVSHIGGDRFAANVLVLRDGLYYGRLDAESAARVAAAHRAGRLDLAHLRGRSGYPFAVQAAEWHARRELGDDVVTSTRLLGRSARGDEVGVDLALAGGQWRVVLREGRTPPARLTCAAARESPAPRFDLVSLAPLDR